MGLSWGSLSENLLGVLSCQICPWWGKGLERQHFCSGLSVLVGQS